MEKNSKQRLFEMMSKVDKSFKIKLNEDYDWYGELQQKIKNGDVWLEYYPPSASQEYTDGENWWNRGGQQLRSPREYDRSDPEWTPFGDEGDGYDDDLYENALNEDRAVYTNLLQMFQENNLRPGSFIALGYVKGVEIPKRVFPTNANEEYANKLINAADEYGLSDMEVNILKEMITSEIWGKTKAGEIQLKKKKAPKTYFELDNKLSGIIQFNRYVLNYMDRASLAKNFKKQTDSEIELRRKYGFGRDDYEYPEDDWRQKYGGTGAMKVTNRGGSTYKDKPGNIPVYGDLDKEGNPRINPKTGFQRMTLKQNISSNLKRLDTDYFLVDEDGNLNQISYKFVNFFTKYVKQVRDSVKELQDEEKQFVEELKNIENQYFSTQFISDRIAYITATVEDDKTKEKKPIYFYNDNLDVLEEFPVNIQQLQNHINQYMKDSFKTAKEMAGSDAPLGENKINLSEKRFEPETYYNTQSEAVDAAVQKAESMGYEVDKDDIWRYFGQGWVGYENDRKGIITLYKNGVEQRKALNISIYRMPSGTYELTTYIN